MMSVSLLIVFVYVSHMCLGGYIILKLTREQVLHQVITDLNSDSD